MVHRALYLLGLCLFLASSVASAQSWPPPSPMSWQVYGCPWGNAVQTPQPSIAAAISCIQSEAPTYQCVQVANATCGALENEACVSCNGDASARRVQFMGVCPSGGTLNRADNTCVNNLCTAQGGETHSFDHQFNGSCPSVTPSSTCMPSGCRAEVISSSKMGFTHIFTGGSACLWSGTAQITSNPCQTGDPVVTDNGVTSERPTAAPTLSAGGAGLIGDSSGQNIARIASNTARTAAALEGMAAGSGGSGGSGASGEWQGEEGAAAQAGADSIDGAAAAVKGTVESAADAVLSFIRNPSDFGGSSARWVLGFNNFWAGATATCSHTWTINFPNMWPQQWTLDICPWAPYFREFMFWALGLLTAWSLWSTIYSTARKA